MPLKAGDIAWVDLDPVKGSEQAGRRPALIISGAIYHEASRRAVICPITRNTRPWPFNVPLPPGLETKGTVLVDQVRSIDRAERLFDFVERAPPEVLADVRGQLAALFGIDTVPSITGSE
jgi:mRNA interferase MazF